MDLELNRDEFVIAMMIDYLNEFNKSVNISILSEKCKMDADAVDSIISDMIGKGFLKMVPMNRRMTYSLEGLFLSDEKGSPYEKNSYQSLFEIFEQEFGRPLSQKESEQLSAWIQTYDLKLIEYALRESVSYNKVAFAYINKILMNWKEKNYTAKMYEEGKSL